MAALMQADYDAIGQVTNRAQAARLHARLAERLTQPALTDRRKAETRAAMRVLEEQFPDLRTPAQPDSSPAPEPSPAQPGNSPARPAGGNASRGSARQVRSSKRKPAGKTGSTKGRRRVPGGRAARQIGADAASHAEPVGQFVITVLGATVAFAVFYALLRNASGAGSGRAAIEVVSKSSVEGLRNFVLPVDPLDPKGTAGRIGTTAGSIQSVIDAAGKTASQAPTQTHTR